jgi:CCR4-NOT transcriptional regulation complex NOT5 subunit
VDLADTETFMNSRQVLTNKEESRKVVKKEVRTKQFSYISVL